jgi:hypothetical protein
MKQETWVLWVGYGNALMAVKIYLRSWLSNKLQHCQFSKKIRQHDHLVENSFLIRMRFVWLAKMRMVAQLKVWCFGDYLRIRVKVVQRGVNIERISSSMILCIRFSPKWAKSDKIRLVGSLRRFVTSHTLKVQLFKNFFRSTSGSNYEKWVKLICIWIWYGKAKPIHKESNI